MRIIYHDGNIKISIEEYPEIPLGSFIHIEIRQFSLSTYKKIHSVWDEIRRYLKSRGDVFVFCLPPKDKEQFVKHFGFSYTDIIVEGYRIMKREL
jgi:DNA modification methylase